MKTVTRSMPNKISLLGFTPLIGVAISYTQLDQTLREVALGVTILTGFLAILLQIKKLFGKGD